MIDFSELPDVAWVEILSYLSLKDRAQVANTCRILNDAFNHPSLWYQVNINLLCSSQRYSSSSDIILPSKYFHLISNFGKYFQDLTLNFSGYTTGINDDVKEVLEALSQCRLEKLSLSVGVNLSKREFAYEMPVKLDIGHILVLIENAFRLKTLHVKAWPMHSRLQSPDLMAAIRSNDKIKDTLENITLFWSDADEVEWVTLNANLPNPYETLQTVQCLSRLKTLKLRSTMISENLILEIAKSDRNIKKLKVLVTYSEHGTDKLPEISAKAWVLLQQNSPEIWIEFTITTRVPFIELAGLLKPEVNLAAINFMRYSRCQAIDLQSICDKYSSSLQRFTDFSTGTDVDDALINLVENCSRLNHFVYSGEIHHHTVPYIAKMKGKNWSMFQINSSNVITVDLNNDDEDIVVKENQDGNYDVVPHERMKAVDNILDREAVLEVMIHEVAEYLGVKWIPMDLLKRVDVEELKQKLYF